MIKPGHPTARKCARVALRLRIAMNKNKVAKAKSERQNIVVQGSVWSARMKSPPVLHQSADAATRSSPRRRCGAGFMSRMSEAVKESQVAA